MPRYVRPATNDYAEDPIYALGNILRANIIGYVRSHGPCGRAQIAGALNVRPTTISKALEVLLDAGVLQRHPEQPVRGARVNYTLNQGVVSDMWITLGRAIGEI